MQASACTAKEYQNAARRSAGAKVCALWTLVDVRRAVAHGWPPRSTTAVDARKKEKNFTPTTYSCPTHTHTHTHKGAPGACQTRSSVSGGAGCPAMRAWALPRPPVLAVAWLKTARRQASLKAFASFPLATGASKGQHTDGEQSEHGPAIQSLP